MPRWSFPRSAALALSLVVITLTGCSAPPTVPAPLSSAQPAYGASAPPLSVEAAPLAGPAKVALLVPLSGANAALGKAILNAAQLALFASRTDQLTLVPRDTKGTRTGAAEAARAAIAEGVGLILGPLLAPEVEAVKPIAANAHLNVISFSTVTSSAGGNTFLMGFLPKEEVVREVGFARERGFGRFAALVPNSAYGHLMAGTLHQIAAQTGGSVTDIEFFPPGGDAEDAIHHLLPNGAVPPVASAEDSTAGDAPARSRPAEFDALVLPEGGEQLNAIARQLAAAGLDTKTVRLLGSGLWDEPGIGSEPTLVGGWFAASPPDARQGFDHGYRAAYGSDPPRLASLGYDAAALAGVLASGEAGPPFSRQAILDPKGFTGVDGLFRFTPDGLVQRALAVLEVEPEANVVVSPARQTFRTLSY